MRGDRTRAAFALAVCGLTAAQRAGAIPIGSVAAGSDAIAHGRSWLLRPSALFADRPTAPSRLALVLPPSAICASRLGAVAAVVWRRLGSARARLGIVAAVALLGLIG